MFLLAHKVDFPPPNFTDAGVIGNVRKKINTAIDYAQEICEQIDAREFAVRDTVDSMERLITSYMLGAGMPIPPGNVTDKAMELMRSGTLTPGTIIKADGTVTLPEHTAPDWVQELSSDTLLPPNASPELQECANEVAEAMLDSPGETGFMDAGGKTKAT